MDYHVEADGHYYSVPYQHLGDQVEVRTSAAIIEMILDGQRIASSCAQLPARPARDGARAHARPRTANTWSGVHPGS